jgi:ribosomal RNA-processing protein 7
MTSPELLENGFYRIYLPNLSRKGKSKVIFEESCRTSTPHELLFRAHKSHKTHPLLPADRTLFVANLPIDTSSSQLQQFFQSCGKVERVIIGAVAAEDTLESIQLRNQQQTAVHSPPLDSCEMGYVIFKKAGSMDKINSLRSESWNVKLSSPLGLESMHTLKLFIFS